MYRHNEQNIPTKGFESARFQEIAKQAGISIDLRELLRADKPDRAGVMSRGDEISNSTAQLINQYLAA